MRARSIALCAALLQGAVAFAQEPVSIGDLVRRVQLPLAAVSPDGQLAAYVLLRADPVQDNYSAEVVVLPLRNAGQSATLARYVLAPAEAFDETGGFRPSAGELRWTSDDTLVFLTKHDSKMELLAWSARGRTVKSLAGPHDRIVIDSDESSEQLYLHTSDLHQRQATGGDQVPDGGWRIRDGYRFYGAFKNPTSSGWSLSQKWILSLERDLRLIPIGVPEEGWQTTPLEWTYRAPKSTTKDSLTYQFGAIRSPNGRFTVAIEVITQNLGDPEESYTSSRIVNLQDAEEPRVLVPPTRPMPSRTLLGWAPNSESVYFIEVGASGSTLNRLTLSGKVSSIVRDTGELEAPGAAYDRTCETLSRDGRIALLVRSTNVMPAELVTVDLESGRLTRIASPNEVFSRRMQPEVRFYSAAPPHLDVYGRLFLPQHYRPGTRYPLVITNYYARPGFYLATGDEVPILPLTANGIAVFAMHSVLLDVESQRGDSRFELSRVQKPLRAMEWIIRKLDAEGIVDSQRVGITGLSYGAEIAMYAYFQSGLFRAASVATPSWEQSDLLFGGLGYAKRLEERGFPFPSDPSGDFFWRALSAGLNARATLPPLLIQSPDAEENVTVPTWFQLRRAGAPVEWYEYPDEGHVKRHPSTKWWVYARNLDWFRYWLLEGAEDSDPGKQEQYDRWRAMRQNALNHDQRLTPERAQAR